MSDLDLIAVVERSGHKGVSRTLEVDQRIGIAVVRRQHRKAVVATRRDGIHWLTKTAGQDRRSHVEWGSGVKARSGSPHKKLPVANARPSHLDAKRQSLVNAEKREECW